VIEDGGQGLRFRLVAGILFALTLVLTSGAQQWERLGPQGGLVVSLDTNASGTLYLGTADGHVFASNDGASSWQLRGRVGNRLDAVVTRLVVDGQDPNHLLAAVWYREAAENGGIFGSEDGGRTWRSSGLQGEAVRALEAAPSNPAELLAGTRTGVFRSRDRGVTWQRISPAGDPELRNVDSIAIDPRDPDVIYAGTYHLPWRTKNGGRGWEPVIAGLIDDSDIMSLRLDATNPDRLYMSACSGIYRSENQGGEWTKLQGIPYAARRTQTIVQDSRNPKIFYAGTTEGAWVTRDAGETWRRITPKDWVVNAVRVLPSPSGSSGRVVMGTESGIQVSDDNGETFAASNVGFTHVVVKQLAAGFNGDDDLLLLVQRNGWELLESTDRGGSWASILLGKAKSIHSALNADQIQELYGSPWGWLLRMADGSLWVQERATKVWHPWKLRFSPLSPSSRAKASTAKPTAPQAISLAPTGKALAFASDFALVSSPSGLLRCAESGICTRLKVFAGPGPASAVWISTDGSQIAAIQDGKFAFSDDAGQTASWSDLPVAPPHALWISTAPSGNPTLVLGTAAGLFLSDDKGAHWLPSTNGLPPGRMEAWLSRARFWLVTERSGGVYLSANRGASWSRIDQDGERGQFAAFVMLNEISVFAGSHSEGLLKLTVVPAPND
jgi:photosystem II stability/assembly factor-like uncharacterized protein